MITIPNNAEIQTGSQGRTGTGLVEPNTSPHPYIPAATYGRPTILTLLAITLASPALRAQDGSLTIPADQMTQAIQAAKAVDDVNRNKRYDLAAMAAMAVAGYKQKRDLESLQREINEAHDKYLDSQRLAASSRDYRYLSDEDSRKVTDVIDMFGKLPSAGPLADMARHEFYAFTSRMERKLGPENQIAEQAHQVNDYYTLQAYQQQQWKELYAIAAKDPKFGALVDGLFARSLNMSVHDSISQVMAKNPTFRDSGLLQLIAKNLKQDGELTVDKGQLITAYKEVVAKTLAGMSRPRATSSATKSTQRANPRTKPLSDPIRDAAMRDSEHQAATSSIFIISAVIGYKDPKLSHQISVTGNSMISIADAIDKFREPNAALKGVSGLTTMSSIILTANILAAVGNVVSLFGQDPNAVMLEQFKALQASIASLRQEMRDRFDAVDLSLNNIYNTLIRTFEELELQITRTQLRVEDLQVGLLRLRYDLSRLEQSLYEYLNDLSERMTNRGIAYCLEHEALTGEPLSEADYRRCQTDFFTWATKDSRDRLSSPPVLDARFGDFPKQLRQYPLSSKVNFLFGFLKQFDPTAVPLTAPIVNPVVWASGARAYAQLAEQSPTFFDRTPPLGLDRLIELGEDFEESLRRLTVDDVGGKREPRINIANSLMKYYGEKAESVSDEVSRLQADYLKNEAQNVNLWSSADQPIEYTLKHQTSPVLAHLGDRDFRFDVPPDIVKLIPREAIVAEKLGLGDITFGIAGLRSNKRLDHDYESGREGDRTEINVVMNAASVVVSAYFKDLLIMRREIHGETKHQICKGENVTDCSGPDEQHRVYEIVAGNWAAGENLMGRFVAESQIVSGVADPIAASQTEITRQVAAKFTDLRKGLYLRIAKALSEESAMSRKAEELTFARDVIELYSQLAMPESLMRDEQFHSMLYGRGRLPDAELVRGLYARAIGLTGQKGGELKPFDLRSLLDTRLRSIRAAMIKLVKLNALKGQYERQAIVAGTLDDLLELRSKHSATPSTSEGAH